MLKLFAASLALSLASQIASAYDGLQNHYRVRIDADAGRAHVEANVWVDGDRVALYNVMPTDALKNGQADLLESLTARTPEGAPLALRDKGEGEYALEGDRRVVLRYAVRLEHGDHHWPSGAEEVSYRTDEGLMASGYALFLAPVKSMPGRTRVDFSLPQGWRAHTPWQALEAPGSFIVGSRRELLNNAMFLGTARAERIEAGGLELTLVMGRRYWHRRDAFVDLIRRQAESYRELFGAAPLAARYLVVINQGDTGDGGAFSGSFSQFLRGDGDADTLPIWGRVVAHELAHFWNGLSLVPADDGLEWFKEGVTDYLTVTTMTRNGLAGRDYLMRWLENLPRGQFVARLGMGLRDTVQDAGRDKHGNWLLVYGGGSRAALAIDVAMRRETGGRSGLPDLMRALYREFAAPGKRYGHDDIVRTAARLGAPGVGPLLEAVVRGTAMQDERPVFAAIGLRLEQYPLLESFLLPDPAATPAERQRFSAIFGMPD